MVDSEPSPSPSSRQQYGLTRPLSLDGPSEADTISTQELNKLCGDTGLYESAEVSVKREDVLAHSNRYVIIVDWVKQLTRQRGYTDQMVEDANAVIITFGSYRLGVHAPGTRIDALCVGPSYVNRDDINIFDGSVLYNVDEPTVRSLNSCRVADHILKHVPNVEHFRTTLRCINFWAKKRNIYSSVDLVAENSDDLRKWKDWVESRLSQLTLMIERDTFGKLQCHPYPNEFSDPSKRCSHNAYFMGLQRKQRSL